MNMSVSRVPHAEQPTGTWLSEIERLATVPRMHEAFSRRWSRYRLDCLREIAILGAAGEGERLLRICAERNIVVRLLADGDEAKIGTTVGGVAVAPYEALHRLPRSCPIVIASHRILDATRRLRTVGFEHVASFAVLQVLAPEIFRPHMFYDGWFEDLAAGAADYRSLATLLADRESRQVLDALMGFRLTLDPELLAPVLQPDCYVIPGRALRDDEVYLDGGAYDGDSVRWFIARANNRFARILAFEPDTATFARLCANFADDPRVEPVNRGLYAEDGDLMFNADGSRGARLTEGGDLRVPVTTVDSILAGERATFIKMNIEGAELEALRGARKTIQRHEPTLAISAYHAPSHLREVPFLIRELNPGYRIYLRQHDGGVIETVCYGVADGGA